MFGGKPFNPILGETFQAKIGETEVYTEQTSHHPPILNYYVKNPLFTCFGYSEIEIIARPNSIKAETKGKFYYKFNDGILLRVSPPKYHVNGLMIGKRYISYSECLTVEDLVLIFNK